MSQYTTGEIAKRCGVSVRTVQYYDTRGILTPSALSEGGRRLYSGDDLSRMKVICFLRELSLPLDAIGQLLSEEDPGSVIALLIDQQAEVLRGELEERRQKLEKLEALRRELRSTQIRTVESIGDIAKTMQGKKKLKNMRWAMVLFGIPVAALQWAAIILGIVRGDWRLLAVWAPLALIYGVSVSRYYFKNVAYLCPQCHEVFRPAIREAFFARHTPNTRRLTCTNCGHHGYCVEVWAGSEAADNA